MSRNDRNPLKMLTKSVNNLVLIRLKDGKEFRGYLVETDTYMNLVLSSAEELKDGQPIAKFGEAFIRGNNILFIKPDLSALDSDF